jgi:ATP-dependent DNA helicase PIF1
MDTTMNTWAPEVPAQAAPAVSDQVTATTSTSSTVDARAVRAWAKAQGIEVGARGRIKPDVIARYNDAHGA